MCKVKIQLHAKLIAIGCNNYLCLNSILQNGHQHNSPQPQSEIKENETIYIKMKMTLTITSKHLIFILICRKILLISHLHFAAPACQFSFMLR